MNKEERKAYNQQYHQANKDRAKRIYYTLTPAEYRDIEKRAKVEGENIHTLIKNMALAYHQQAPIMPEMIRDELQELRFLLRNVANNINQIAHHSNTIRKLADENGLLLEIQKMETTINEFITQRMKR